MAGFIFSHHEALGKQRGRAMGIGKEKCRIVLDADAKKARAVIPIARMPTIMQKYDHKTLGFSQLSDALPPAWLIARFDDNWC
jgi:hypothetical protein